MACELMKQTEQARQAREQALEELAQDLATGKRKVRRNMLTGKVTVSNWETSAAKQAGWCEACAVNGLKQRGLWSQQKQVQTKRRIKA